MTRDRTVKSTCAVPKMDCPSEERLIRLALDPVAGVQSLGSELEARPLTVVHPCPAEEVAERLVPIGLGAELVEATEHDGSAPPSR